MYIIVSEIVWVTVSANKKPRPIYVSKQEMCTKAFGWERQSFQIEIKMRSKTPRLNILF